MKTNLPLWIDDGVNDNIACWASTDIRDQEYHQMGTDEEPELLSQATLSNSPTLMTRGYPLSNCKNKIMWHHHGHCECYVGQG